LVQRCNQADQKRIALASAATWWPQMTSIYEQFAKDCAKMASKTKNGPERTRLLQLAGQWQGVAAEQEGETGKTALLRTRELWRRARKSPWTARQRLRARRHASTIIRTVEEQGKKGGLLPLCETTAKKI
jgi:hypothetical protein